MELTEGTAAGISYADLYHLGTTDPAGATPRKTSSRWVPGPSRAPSIDGIPRGCPPARTSSQDLRGSTSSTDNDTPDEPVEIGVPDLGVHNVTETLEVDVLIDAGADGVFADEELQADFMAVKLAAPGGVVCVFALAHLRGLRRVVLRRLQQLQQQPRRVGVGRSDDRSGRRRVRLRVQRDGVHGTFFGDVPGTVCDTAGRDRRRHRHVDLMFDAADPALVIDPLVCKGFWDGATAMTSIRSVVGTALDRRPRRRRPGRVRRLRLPAPPEPRRGLDHRLHPSIAPGGSVSALFRMSSSSTPTSTSSSRLNRTQLLPMSAFGNRSSYASTSGRARRPPSRGARSWPCCWRVRSDTSRPRVPRRSGSDTSRRRASRTGWRARGPAPTSGSPRATRAPDCGAVRGATRCTPRASPRSPPIVPSSPRSDRLAERVPVGDTGYRYA